MIGQDEYIALVVGFFVVTYITYHLIKQTMD
jgi:hypothetical protein